MNFASHYTNSLNTTPLSFSHQVLTPSLSQNAKSLKKKIKNVKNYYKPDVRVSPYACDICNSNHDDLYVTVNELFIKTQLFMCKTVPIPVCASRPCMRLFEVSMHA